MDLYAAKKLIPDLATWVQCFSIIIHSGAVLPDPGEAGADLGFLEWRDCKYKRARSARENFKSRPLNKNHTPFNYLALPSPSTVLCPSKHSNKCKTSGCTTACLESGFTTRLELTTTTTKLFAM